MLELMAMGKPSAVPGGDTLIGEYTRPNGGHTGYYGRVAQSDLITYTDLHTMVAAPGVNTTASTSSVWLKMTIDGKTLFIFQTQTKYNANFDNFNAKGIMKGTKTVTIKGKTYKVRALTGLGVATGTTSQTADSEWNRLMYNICSSTVSGQEGDKWDNFTPAELGLHGGNGSFTMTPNVNSANTSQIVMRGFSSINGVGTVFTGQATTYQYMGWRPVLELVG